MPSPPMQMWYCSVSLQWKTALGSRRAGAGAGAADGAVASSVPSHRSGELLDRLVLQVPGGRHHDRGRQVSRIVVGGDRVHRQRRHHVAAADHRPPERMVAEHGRRQHVVDLVLRLVLVHRDLLEHDLALGLEVGIRGAQQHVPHHLERAIEVLVEEVRVQDRRLLAGGRVHVGAEAVELLGDLLGRELLGALEQHVLEEVGDPACSFASSREPTRTHMPSATDLTDGTRSVTTRMPESSWVRVCSCANGLAGR